MRWTGSSEQDQHPRARTGSAPAPRPGDEIMVLPEPNVKNLQLAKSLAEILFQLAITTSVLTGL